MRGSISSSNANDASSKSSTLSSASDSIGSSIGYNVISSSVNVYYDDQVYVEE